MALLSPAKRMLSVADFGAVGDGVADDTAALQAALDRVSANGGTFIDIPPGTYKVTATLNIAFAQDSAAHVGILSHGAILQSAITDGSPLLQVISNAVVRFFMIEGLQIRGNGQEGHGLVLRADNQAVFLYNICLRDVFIEGCGGDGCQILGNIFESQIDNSFFRQNRNGLSMGNSTGGGILSAIHLYGCVFGQNREVGCLMVNDATDAGFHGCYFLENGSWGANCPNGFTLMSNCGFENNWMSAGSFAAGNAGVAFQNFGNMIACSATSRHYQTHLVKGYVTSIFAMSGCFRAGVETAGTMHLSDLSGTPGGRASIVSCNGERDYRDGFQSRTTEMACIP
ncbi:MAG: glycoside hydrolase family 55 protein [Ferrovibrio sp.]|uniref:glycosyl hydrolase family 28-related protein n=1 Tax=Ferrovibrio sp. TaxID=1917215 RepID=UPI002621F6A5|nr:glycosyl hydrolase family 28-related protein [Ferrovibrio sp.]MCW0234165.1 glycoside hydrolase family 55 protein [Ferrovibrio sp.]